MSHPALFHERQLLLAERSKRKSKHQTTSPRNSVLHSFLTITVRALSPSPRPHSPSSSCTSLTLLPPPPLRSLIHDYALRVLVFPLYALTCLLIWIRWDSNNYDFTPCYNLGKSLFFTPRMEGDGQLSKLKKAMWPLWIPLWTFRAFVESSVQGLDYVVCDNERKKTKYKLLAEEGIRVKRRYVVNAFVFVLKSFEVMFFTVLGIHLMILKLTEERFEETEALVNQLRAVWWRYSLRHMEREDQIAVVADGRCLLLSAD